MDSFIVQFPAWVGIKNGFQTTTNEVEVYKEPNKKFYQTTQWKTEHQIGTFPMELYTQGPG